MWYMYIRMCLSIMFVVLLIFVPMQQDNLMSLGTALMQPRIFHKHQRNLLVDNGT